MRVLRFVVPGAPRGKGRPRFARAGRFVRAYTDDKTAAYENLVAVAARAALLDDPPFDGPVAVNVVAAFLRPSSARKRKHPTVKPDIDNVLKAVLDGLQQSGIWRDDAQAVEVCATKVYGDPGCSITVREVV